MIEDSRVVHSHKKIFQYIVILEIQARVGDHRLIFLSFL
ncbi:hypothetical protein LEP1GSC104_1683 [Leptospira interrogans str. UI 12621]|uniref:Uncharacterized protein n=1 Tax=Leptospira interrogans str. UI 12621 TaxID=1049937 RepID=A0A0F6HCJ0_LEPIR|nr:hypothetical protein LEP1GSC104_1683 [Leptospira interrogans str. UI 12621]